VPCHDLLIVRRSQPAAIGQEVLDDLLGVGFSHDGHAAGIADELIGTLPLTENRFLAADLVFILGILLFPYWVRTIALLFAPGRPEPGKHKRPPRHALPGGS
jgi:hypothetical protein